MRSHTLLARGLLIAGVAGVLAGCNTTQSETTASFPIAYQERHPITIKEGDHAIKVFVGAGRGGLTPAQRAEVLAFAQTWRNNATGGITIERPIGGVTERAALDSLKQILSILVSAGIPNNGIGIHPYQSSSRLATIRISYPQVVASAGPCGLWPEDLGPSPDPSHFDNRPYWNLGCATQHNLAVQLDNPADIVQPRGETPVYTAKRTFGIDKWRKGESPATTYPDSQKGAISDLGK